MSGRERRPLDGRIERFKEKPRSEEVFSRVINAGTYVLEPEVLKMIPPATKYDFSKNLYMDMLEKGRGLYATPLKGYWKDIGRPSDLYLANMDMASRRPSTQSPTGAKAVGNCYFGKGVTALAASVKDSAVGRGCVLEGTIEGSLLLDRVVVGKGATIHGCVIGENCRVGDGASLSDCVLGDGASVSPGKILAGTNVEAGSSI
jgi:NDP-sugar pyrophosphorylase family protein